MKPPGASINSPGQESFSREFMPIAGTDYLEFYVGNAKQAAHYYKSAFGFQSLAYAGLETGRKDLETYVLEQGKIRIALTSPLQSKTIVGKHIDGHGDGVKIIAFTVTDAGKAYAEAIRRGAESYIEPYHMEDEDGMVICSGIHTYGEVVHVFVERGLYTGSFLPGYKQWSSDYNPAPTGLLNIDHIVGNVEMGKMNEWVEFYRHVLGFTQILSFDDKDISTEYTALKSKVMSKGNGRIKFPINEPAAGLKRSQVDEFLDFYEGAGVQHVALETEDIIQTVRELKSRGVEFLQIPESYYEGIGDRVGEIKEEIATLRELDILVDRDEEGYMLQIFTKTVNPRPTMFFEIIQRKGARSFGKGNFKALFEAIESEQALRGTL